MSAKTHRNELMAAMHRAGLRLDDAGIAAQIAESMLREERNRMMLKARIAGLSVRLIGRIFGVTHVCVIKSTPSHTDAMVTAGD